MEKMKGGALRVKVKLNRLVCAVAVVLAAVAAAANICGVVVAEEKLDTQYGMAIDTVAEAAEAVLDPLPDWVEDGSPGQEMG